MNNWREPYPENLNDLIIRADKFHKDILKHICQSKRLSELYEETDKVRRIVNQFPDFDLNSKLTSDRRENNELKGLYFFGEDVDGEVVPVYVGISRTIFRRLRQHGWGKKHNECTLAFNMAKSKNFENDYKEDRNKMPETFLNKEKALIQNFRVYLIPVDSDFELYFLEVTLAGLLKTKWNSFRTH